MITFYVLKEQSMSYKTQLSKLLKTPLTYTSIALLTLTGCGSSDDSGTGYFQLYNTSSTAPAIYLTVDQYDDDDYTESTHTGIEYTNVSSRLQYDSDTYDIELAWKDEDYDLELIYEDQLAIQDDVLKFIVVAENIKEPNVQIYDIPVRDDDEKDDDDDDDLFNMRFLNMYLESSNVDIYLSESDETFNEAELIAQSSYTELTENQKFDQDDYIFYLTEAGSDDVLFTSNEISFPYASEYIVVVRENKGAGDSPYVMDIIATSSVTELVDSDSEAAFRIYNGIVEHELLPNYNNTIDLHIDGIDDSPEVSTLAFGEFSDSIKTDFNDYNISVLASEDNSPLIENHLLTLNANSDKTVFFYLTEDNVDEDGDGDVDEDGDGYVDEIEITLNSLVVDNSQNESIYTHQINVINLIDHDDFSSVTVYFVKNDEIVDTAENSIAVPYIVPNSISLVNNTYSVYAIAKVDSTDLIISATELVLDDDSKDQFLILEVDESSATGYKATYTEQMVNN